jgi:hypothetical protein
VAESLDEAKAAFRGVGGHGARRVRSHARRGYDQLRLGWQLERAFKRGIGRAMSVDDYERGLVVVVAAERNCFNYRLDDPYRRCSADRCLCLEIARFLPLWLT